MDQVPGAEISEGQNGTVLKRVAIIEGVESNADNRLAIAMAALWKNGYTRGSFPYQGSTLPLDTISIVPASEKSTTKFKATLVYQLASGTTTLPGENEPARLRVGGSVQSTTTNFFIDEVPFTADEANPLLPGGFYNHDREIKVSYTQPIFNDDGEPIGSVGDPITQGAEVGYVLPMRTFEYTRRERFPHTYGEEGEWSNPGHKAGTLLGTINKEEFEGAPKDTVLCTQVTGVPTGEVNVYDVTYGFEYNAKTWHAVVTYKDPETGERPPWLVIGVDTLSPDELADAGIRRFRIYHRFDFTLLNLVVT
jgi:hypothetical protein